MLVIGGIAETHEMLDSCGAHGADAEGRIDDAADGKRVFYRFYADTERAQQPAKNNTGLVLVPRSARCSTERRIWPR